MTIQDKLKKEKQRSVIRQYLKYGANPKILEMEIEERLPLRDVVEILNLMVFKTKYLEQQNSLKDL